MKWVVCCKPPFGGPEQVIRYLGQYTHRVAISNSRLISIKASGVTSWTRDGNTATLEPVEFLRRFVNHVLPARFVKIRHYGLLATGNAKKRWQMARDRLLLLGGSPVTRAQRKPSSDRSENDWQSALLELTGTDVRKCPACELLTMVRRPLA